MGISELRKKLHDSIQKFGLNSKKTYKLSLELDEAIIEHYRNSNMLYYYEKSLEGLQKYVKENGKEPDAKEWNRYAMEKDYLSYESMKYIGSISSQK